MVKKRFLSLVSEPGSIQSQLKDCLSQLSRLFFFTGPGGKRILKQTLFLRAAENRDFQKRKEILWSILESHFGGKPPPTSVVGQPPEGNHELVLEVIVSDNIQKDVSVAYREWEGSRYSVVSTPEGKEVIAAGLTAESFSGDISKLSEDSFSRMNGILIHEGMDFSHVIRQWNYIEDIVGPAPLSRGTKQHYQQFNDVRSHFYGGTEFLNGYPSATGIGQKTGGIIIEFIAASGPSPWVILPVSNPLQVDAHRYSQQVLVGDPLYAKKEKTSPKFERAKLVYSPFRGQVYISGTAAIRGQLTAPEKDAAEQTRITLDNILALVSSENLLKSGFDPQIDKAEISYLRVYTKIAGDIPAVRKVCSEYLPRTPALYLEADVCREDLLVEIEGLLDFSV
jgi:enamine deaminase RidA (YjgF/YER057c/UK114 family)